MNPNQEQELYNFLINNVRLTHLRASTTIAFQPITQVNSGEVYMELERVQVIFIPQNSDFIPALQVEQIALLMDSQASAAEHIRITLAETSPLFVDRQWQQGYINRLSPEVWGNLLAKYLTVTQLVKLSQTPCFQYIKPHLLNNQYIGFLKTLDLSKINKNLIDSLSPKALAEVLSELDDDRMKLLVNSLSNSELHTLYQKSTSFHQAKFIGLLLDTQFQYLVGCYKDNEHQLINLFSQGQPSFLASICQGVIPVARIRSIIISEQLVNNRLVLEHLIRLGSENEAAFFKTSANITSEESWGDYFQYVTLESVFYTLAQKAPSVAEMSLSYWQNFNHVLFFDYHLDSFQFDYISSFGETIIFPFIRQKSKELRDKITNQEPLTVDDKLFGMTIAYYRMKQELKEGIELYQKQCDSISSKSDQVQNAIRSEAMMTFERYYDSKLPKLKGDSFFFACVWMASDFIDAIKDKEPSYYMTKWNRAIDEYGPNEVYEVGVSPPLSCIIM